MNKIQHLKIYFSIKKKIVAPNSSKINMHGIRFYTIFAASMVQVSRQETCKRP